MFLVFSVIKNTVGKVSIIPLREAKTYVNGKCILDPTVLHHVSNCFGNSNMCMCGFLCFVNITTSD